MDLDAEWETRYSSAMNGSISDFRDLVSSNIDGPILGATKLNGLLDIMESLFERYADTPCRNVDDDAALLTTACVALSLHVDAKMVPYEESRGLLWSWPSAWKFTLLSILPLLHNPSLGSIESRCKAFAAAIDLLHHFHTDVNTLRAMFTTPGLVDLVSRLWLMEISDHAFLADTRYRFHATCLMNMLVEEANFDFLGVPVDFSEPLRSRRMTVADTTVKFLRDVCSGAPYAPTHVSRNIHIVTVLSEHDEELRHAFLAANYIYSVTRVLVKLTATHPSEVVEEPERHGSAIEAALWNLWLLVGFTDGSTWVIQALEAKLLLGLLRCEPWLPYLQGHDDECFYSFLFNVLPSYAVYRSVLCVMQRSFTWIVESQLHLSRFSDDPEWTEAWEYFISTLESQWALLSSVPHLLPGYEKCSNVECTQEKASNEFYKCSRCLSAQYCSKACQETDWKGWHKEACDRIRKDRIDAWPHKLPAEDAKFIEVMLDVEREKLKDVVMNSFSDMGNNLLVMDIDLQVYPARAEIRHPEEVRFCEKHQLPLVEWWNDTKKKDLMHPCLMVTASIPREYHGQFIKVVNYGPPDIHWDKQVVYGQGCPCCSGM
ncbi:hypothetical protein GLOTRDRAFT_128115 [Gloeophyllum trabeum ATCC 11539]|uniref:MYND-type domain-containing protein n=1 Tax=Gloeophyllum trabeum (strain ATCC 11539 / FP-39264 / Madison 617) TaxID=670483 RepID=S7RSV7_GLOTA|nr:uncharacterized protein GLOTRDRAFT_128115 [Gloeophyllum trabeum ATCC 11539]EPQ56164.1 hypothetical protein GLOTRDRAFT_128115 [Gloeophyllum trabeum ATCC 11539]